MIEDDPRIDPAGLRDIRFPGSFRRYDSKAVDDFLESVAEKIVATNTLVDDLRRELETARRQSPSEPAGSASEPSPFDAPDLSTLSEDELDHLVGEETAHVLSTARKAASDIRSKAEESAARVIREATATAAQLTGTAEAEAAALTAEATSARDVAVAEAEAEAEELRATAVASADELLATARADAEQIRETAEEERRAAEAEVERIIEEAKDEGRTMVAEAKKVRSRVLEDLQRRRDLGRSQVERLAAGRDELLEAYAAVRANLDEITGRLEVGLREVGSSSSDPLLDDGFAGIVISELEDEVDEADATDEAQPPGHADAGAADGAADDGDAGDPAAADDVEEATTSVAGTDADDDGPGLDPADDDPSADDDADDQDVDALFAKIRAERAESVARAQKVLAGDDAEPGGRTGADDEPVSAVDPEAEQPEEPGDPDHQVPAELLADAEVLAQRSDVLGPLDKDLSRALKRHLADEQNVVLDALRRSESTDPAELFPSLDEHVAGYAAVAEVQLTAAAQAGASTVDADAAVDVGALAAELGSSLIESFRRRIERSAADVDGDADALDERLRALYREWKVEHIGAATTDALLSAYALGQHAAAPKGSSLRWLIDPDQGPCPDAQDNALAGAVPKGEPFPTGDECPQAHPGCRCILVVEV